MNNKNENFCQNLNQIPKEQYWCIKALNNSTHDNTKAKVVLLQNPY